MRLEAQDPHDLRVKHIDSTTPKADASNVLVPEHTRRPPRLRDLPRVVIIANEWRTRSSREDQEWCGVGEIPPIPHIFAVATSSTYAWPH